MPRFNEERQSILEPQRMEYAKGKIEELGYEVTVVGSNRLQFEHGQGNYVDFYPYSGWATGKTIKDGRGLKNLLEQLV